MFCWTIFSCISYTRGSTLWILSHLHDGYYIHSFFLAQNWMGSQLMRRVNKSANHQLIAWTPNFCLYFWQQNYCCSVLWKLLTRAILSLFQEYLCVCGCPWMKILHPSLLIIQARKKKGISRLVMDSITCTRLCAVQQVMRFWLVLPRLEV